MKNAVHGFQPFIAVHGMGAYSKYLKIVQHIRFNAVKPCLCRAHIFRFHAECYEFQFHKTVVSFGKLIGKHCLILISYGIKVVVLHRNLDCGLCFSAASLIDKGKLYIHGRIKVVQKVAPVFKDGGFLIRTCKLIIDVGKINALAVSVF